MKYTLPILSIVLTLSSCAIFTYAPVDKNAYEARHPQAAMPSGPGCFAKCLIQDEFADASYDFAVFTGDESEVGLDTIEWETAPAHTKWIKKKADKNCLSDDPEDCLIWCLIEVPAQFKTFVVVTDTLQTDNYKIVTENKSELVNKGGFTEWRNVLCEKDITTEVSTQIQEALKQRGYYQGEITGEIKKDTRNALVNFQKDNGLPVGQLDFDTLFELEIDYETED